MILCSYHFGHECESWCGLPYEHHDVPLRRHGDGLFLSLVPDLTRTATPMEIAQPAYCTAACLERAMASQPPAPVKREPVAPWRRLDADVAFCFDCEGRARFILPLIPRASRFCCEACAERAGVFGPVSALDPGVLGPWFSPSQDSRTLHGAPVRHAPLTREEVAARIEPTCSGPLSTHGTPVMRFVGSQYTSTARLLCDPCYLAHEKNVRECMDEDDTPLYMAAAGRSVPVSGPPARIGTVPQSIGPGAGIGIWASRGMRR